MRLDEAGFSRPSHCSMYTHNVSIRGVLESKYTMTVKTKTHTLGGSLYIARPTRRIFPPSARDPWCAALACGFAAGEMTISVMSSPRGISFETIDLLWGYILTCVGASETTRRPHNRIGSSLESTRNGHLKTDGRSECENNLDLSHT